MRRNIPAIAASTWARAAVIDPCTTAPIAPNIKTPPRNSRRINSPAPGRPSANVEKRRRTTSDITEFARSPKGSLINPLWGSELNHTACNANHRSALPFTVDQVNNFKTMALAPPGTPLWHAQKDDFAPRLGIAWNARSDLVIRAGAGIFYDLGYSVIGDAMGAFPYVQSKTILHTSFALSGADAAAPPFKTTPLFPV